jgi:hypothetical protein
VSIRSAFFCCLFALSANASSTTRVYQPEEFTFSQQTIGSFRVSARTRLLWREGQPTIRSIDCLGDSQDIEFVVAQNGQIERLQLNFTGEANENGSKPQITLLGDHLWLYVDDQRYEFANFQRESRVANFAYAPVESSEEQVVMPQWIGHSAVRRSSAEPFMDMSRIYSSLIAARRLQWQFKSRDWSLVDGRESSNRLPDGWQSHRYSIDNLNLEEAIGWCTIQVALPIARRLPAPTPFAGEAQ